MVEKGVRWDVSSRTAQTDSAGAFPLWCLFMTDRTSPSLPRIADRSQVTPARKAMCERGSTAAKLQEKCPCICAKLNKPEPAAQARRERGSALEVERCQKLKIMRKAHKAR